MCICVLFTWNSIVMSYPHTYQYTHAKETKVDYSRTKAFDESYLNALQSEINADPHELLVRFNKQSLAAMFELIQMKQASVDEVKKLLGLHHDFSDEHIENLIQDVRQIFDRFVDKLHKENIDPSAISRELDRELRTSLYSKTKQDLLAVFNKFYAQATSIGELDADIPERIVVDENLFYDHLVSRFSLEEGTAVDVGSSTNFVPAQALMHAGMQRVFMLDSEQHGEIDINKDKGIMFGYADATNLTDLFGDVKVDLVIFNRSLEHILKSGAYSVFGKQLIQREEGQLENPFYYVEILARVYRQAQTILRDNGIVVIQCDEAFYKGTQYGLMGTNHLDMLGQIGFSDIKVHFIKEQKQYVIIAQKKIKPFDSSTAIRASEILFQDKKGQKHYKDSKTALAKENTRIQVLDDSELTEIDPRQEQDAINEKWQSIINNRFMRRALGYVRQLTKSREKEHGFSFTQRELDILARPETMSQAYQLIKQKLRFGNYMSVRLGSEKNSVIDLHVHPSGYGALPSEKDIAIALKYPDRLHVILCDDVVFILTALSLNVTVDDYLACQTYKEKLNYLRNYAVVEVYRMKERLFDPSFERIVEKRRQEDLISPHGFTSRTRIHRIKRYYAQKAKKRSLEKNLQDFRACLEELGDQALVVDTNTADLIVLRKASAPVDSDLYVTFMRDYYEFLFLHAEYEALRDVILTQKGKIPQGDINYVQDVLTESRDILFSIKPRKKASKINVVAKQRLTNEENYADISGPKEDGVPSEGLHISIDEPRDSPWLGKLEALLYGERLKEMLEFIYEQPQGRSRLPFEDGDDIRIQLWEAGTVKAIFKVIINNEKEYAIALQRDNTHDEKTFFASGERNMFLKNHGYKEVPDFYGIFYTEKDEEEYLTRLVFSLDEVKGSYNAMALLEFVPGEQVMGAFDYPREKVSRKKADLILRTVIRALLRAEPYAIVQRSSFLKYEYDANFGNFHIQYDANGEPVQAIWVDQVNPFKSNFLKHTFESFLLHEVYHRYYKDEISYDDFKSNVEEEILLSYTHLSQRLQNLLRDNNAAAWSLNAEYIKQAWWVETLVPACIAGVVGSLTSSNPFTMGLYAAVIFWLGHIGRVLLSIIEPSLKEVPLRVKAGILIQPNIIFISILTAGANVIFGFSTWWGIPLLCALAFMHLIQNKLKDDWYGIPRDPEHASEAKLYRSMQTEGAMPNIVPLNKKFVEDIKKRVKKHSAISNEEMNALLHEIVLRVRLALLKTIKEQVKREHRGLQFNTERLYLSGKLLGGRCPEARKLITKKINELSHDYFEVYWLFTNEAFGGGQDHQAVIIKDTHASNYYLLDPTFRQFMIETKHPLIKKMKDSFRSEQLEVFLRDGFIQIDDDFASSYINAFIKGRADYIFRNHEYTVNDLIKVAEKQEKQKAFQSLFFGDAQRTITIKKPRTSTLLSEEQAWQATHQVRDLLVYVLNHKQGRRMTPLSLIDDIELRFLAAGSAKLMFHIKQGYREYVVSFQRTRKDGKHYFFNGAERATFEKNAGFPEVPELLAVVCIHKDYDGNFIDVTNIYDRDDGRYEALAFLEYIPGEEIITREEEFPFVPLNEAKMVFETVIKVILRMEPEASYDMRHPLKYSYDYSYANLIVSRNAQGKAHRLTWVDPISPFTPHHSFYKQQTLASILHDLDRGFFSFHHSLDTFEYMQETISRLRNESIVVNNTKQIRGGLFSGAFIAAFLACMHSEKAYAGIVGMMSEEISNVFDNVAIIFMCASLIVFVMKLIKEDTEQEITKSAINDDMAFRFVDMPVLDPNTHKVYRTAQSSHSVGRLVSTFSVDSYEYFRKYSLEDCDESYDFDEENEEGFRVHLLGPNALDTTMIPPGLYVRNKHTQDGKTYAFIDPEFFVSMKKEKLSTTILGTYYLKDCQAILAFGNDDAGQEVIGLGHLVMDDRAEGVQLPYRMFVKEVTNIQKVILFSWDHPDRLRMAREAADFLSEQGIDVKIMLRPAMTESLLWLNEKGLFLGVMAFDNKKLQTLSHVSWHEMRRIFSLNQKTDDNSNAIASFADEHFESNIALMNDDGYMLKELLARNRYHKQAIDIRVSQNLGKIKIFNSRYRPIMEKLGFSIPQATDIDCAELEHYISSNKRPTALLVTPHEYDLLRTHENYKKLRSLLQKDNVFIVALDINSSLGYVSMVYFMSLIVAIVEMFKTTNERNNLFIYNMFGNVASPFIMPRLNDLKGKISDKLTQATRVRVFEQAA